MKYYLIAALVSVSLQLHHLTFNNTIKTIQIYNAEGAIVNLKLTFEHSELQLHQSFKNRALFLDKNGKYQLDKGKRYTKYDFKRREGIIEEDGQEIMGSIGMKTNSTIFPIIKEAIKVDDIKLEVNHKKGLINILEEPCRYPLFPPLQMTLSQSSTHTYTIQRFSSNFQPDSSFLKLIGKEKNLFEISAQQLKQQITTSVKNKIISIPLKELLSCGRYASSNSFECEVQTQANADMGGLLFYFDPIFCKSGIELQQSVEVSWGFHYSHLILLGIQFLVLLCLANQDKVLSFVCKMNIRKRH